MVQKVSKFSRAARAKYTINQVYTLQIAPKKSRAAREILLLFGSSIPILEGIFARAAREIFKHFLH